MSDIERKIERSSLGTTNARAARRTISAAEASKLVAKAAAMAQPSGRKKSGGQSENGTYTSDRRPIQPGEAT